MSQRRNMNSSKVFFPIALLMVLPGCLFKQDGVEIKDAKKSKKVALVDKAAGIPLSGKDEGKFYDKEVEAFVLEDADGEEGLKFDVNREMQLARADMDNESKHWKEDAGFDQAAFEPIFFDFDKEDIRQDQETALAFDVQEAQKAAQEGAVVVAGHSDSHFISETYNIAKSEKRARSVAHKLEDAGVAKDKIKVIGYGDRQKLVDVAGKEEKNRRVELKKVTRRV